MLNEILRHVLVPEPDYGDSNRVTNFVQSVDRKYADLVLETAGLKPSGDALAQLHSAVVVELVNGGKYWRGIVRRRVVKNGRYVDVVQKTGKFRTQLETAVAVCALIDGKRVYVK